MTQIEGSQPRARYSQNLVEAGYAALLAGRPKTAIIDFEQALKWQKSNSDANYFLARAFIDLADGAMFRHWASTSNMGAYNSWGDGSAMRVSAVPYFAADEAQLFELTARQTAITHNHPDAIVGAQAVALATWMAMLGAAADSIRQEITDRFGYDITPSVDDIRPHHTFDVSCAGTTPTAIICALAAADYEDVIHNAISLGGDSDTLACIAGGIAEAIFGVPEKIAATAWGYLTDELDAVVKRFLTHIDL